LTHIDRYWGDSSPYDDLTTENLQYLTLENSISDLTYFANNVKLPFDTNSSSNAQHAVWSWLILASFTAKANYTIAMGPKWGIIQRCPFGLDRINFPGHLLGLSCIQCTCASYLRFCEL